MREAGSELGRRAGNTRSARPSRAERAKRSDTKLSAVADTMARPPTGLRQHCRFEVADILHALRETRQRSVGRLLLILLIRALSNGMMRV